MWGEERVDRIFCSLWRCCDCESSADLTAAEEVVVAAR